MTRNQESVVTFLSTLDAVMPFIDGERGARARLEQLNKFFIRQYKKNKARKAEQEMKNDARQKKSGII